MGDVVVGGCLGHSAHVMIGGEVKKVVSRTATLDFQRADFSLVRDLVDSPLGGGSER